jgi:hypothetical protein
MNTAFTTTHSNGFILCQDWQVDIGIAAGCILGYVFAWIGLVCFLYLEHWMAGVIGAFAGGLVGWLWYLLRNDGSKSGIQNN